MLIDETRAAGVRKMINRATVPAFEPIDHAAIDAALAVAFRELRLEHARLGRTVSQSHNGMIVELTPAEVFAEYGLDEFGRPKPPRLPLVNRRTTWHNKRMFATQRRNRNAAHC
jgi:hypothetical protein